MLLLQRWQVMDLWLMMLQWCDTQPLNSAAQRADISACTGVAAAVHSSKGWSWSSSATGCSSRGSRGVVMATVQEAGGPKLLQLAVHADGVLAAAARWTMIHHHSSEPVLWNEGLHGVRDKGGMA